MMMMVTTMTDDMVVFIGGDDCHEDEIQWPFLYYFLHEQLNMPTVTKVWYLCNNELFNLFALFSRTSDSDFHGYLPEQTE